ncbi:DUF551 domain-containing protein [Escherichia coli]
MAYAFHHALSDSSLGADEVEEIKAGLRAAFANVTIQPEPVVPDEIALAIENLKQKLVECNRYNYCADAVKGVEDACHAAMLQGIQPVSQTYNLPELIEGMEVSIDVSTCDADLGNRYFGTVTEALELDTAKNGYILLVQDAEPNFDVNGNSPVIPGDVLSAILKVARVRADFDDFDGDRRGIGDCLDEAEQELIVTINKHASQLAAGPIAPNDVREQTAIPPVPGTPDGWISCSDRMPDNNHDVLFFDVWGYIRIGWFSADDRSWFTSDDGCLMEVTHWMPLPEPPQG